MLLLLGALGWLCGSHFEESLAGQRSGIVQPFPSFPERSPARGHNRGSQHARVSEQSRGAPLSQAFLRR